jgi:hypothetical protein
LGGVLVGEMLDALQLDENLIFNDDFGICGYSLCVAARRYRSG